MGSEGKQQEKGQAKVDKKADSRYIFLCPTNAQQGGNDMERMTLNPAICAAMHALNQALYAATGDRTTPIDQATLRTLCDEVLTRMKDPAYAEVTDCTLALLDILDGYDDSRKAAFDKAKADFQAICEAFGVRPTLVPGL